MEGELLEALIQVKDVDSLNKGNGGGKAKNAVGVRNIYIGREVNRTRSLIGHAKQRG